MPYLTSKTQNTILPALEGVFRCETFKNVAFYLVFILRRNALACYLSSSWQSQLN